MRTAGVDRLTVNSSGNVGIGTAAPTEKLEVYGTSPNILIANIAETNAGIKWHDVQGTTTQNAAILWSSSTNYMSFSINNNPLMTITTIRVGIGVTAPATTLDVTSGTIRYNSIQGGYGNSAGNNHVDAKAGTTGACYLNWFSGTGGLRVGNGASGYGAAYASAFTVASDRRLKENISYFDSGLAQILQLKPATFDFINGENNQKGFIAQDVETVIPEVVGSATMPDSSGNVDETDEYLTLNQPAIIPYLVAAIKEQQAMILALTDRISTLEA
jgi:hypothetical protein